VRIPKRIDSPINEAVFEIRYEGPYPGEALYGILLDVFQSRVGKQVNELPIMQIPKQIREVDPMWRYQAYYTVSNGRFALSVGPRIIAFSALRPYKSWSEWMGFCEPIIAEIQKKDMIQRVERIGLRYLDLFDDNIFDKINAGINVNGKNIVSIPSSFSTEFDDGGIHVILNIGNAITVNNGPESKSLIDINCLYSVNYDTETFFHSYITVLEKAHLVNKQVFFGLLKSELLETLKPEY
jgi:uncharacterized protein (TIGR04255 family)